jgi:hypothetical protein
MCPTTLRALLPGSSGVWRLGRTVPGKVHSTLNDVVNHDIIAVQLDQGSEVSSCGTSERRAPGRSMCPTTLRALLPGSSGVWRENSVPSKVHSTLNDVVNHDIIAVQLDQGSEVRGELIRRVLATTKCCLMLWMRTRPSNVPQMHLQLGGPVTFCMGNIGWPGPHPQHQAALRRRQYPPGSDGSK